MHNAGSVEVAPQVQPTHGPFSSCAARPEHCSNIRPSLQDSIAVLDDLLQHALEGLQVKAQLDTGTLPKKAAMQPAMKVSPQPAHMHQHHLLA